MKQQYKVIHTHKYGTDTYRFQSNEPILNKSGKFTNKTLKRVIDLFEIDFTPKEYMFETIVIEKISTSQKVKTLPEQK